MVPSFNLVDQPWIPCLQRDGQVIELSLRDLFARAHALVDVAADSPMESAALYRFLVAILHRNFGPANSKQWQVLWQRETFPLNTINAYLSEWHERFELFSNDYPFYQSLEEIQFRSSLVDFRHGTGFTPNTHFNHEATKDTVLTYTPAKAARVLLATQNFSFGGGYHGEHSYAPCTFGALFMVIGENLRETLLLNLTRYPDKEDSSDDRPAWEMEDAYDLNRTHPFGKTDYLTWHNRRIRLAAEITQSGEILITDWSIRPGLKMAAEQMNFMSHYKPSKKSGYYSLSFDEDKLLWRNSHSLLTLEGITGHLPPRAISWLRFLVVEGMLPQDRTLQCRALGLHRSNADAKFARQEQFPLPLSLLSDEKKLAQLKEAIDSVERASWVMICNLALTGMYLHLDEAKQYGWARYNITHYDDKGRKAEKDLGQLKTTQGEVVQWMNYTGVERHFWAALDTPFMSFMEMLGEADEDGLTAVKIWWQGQVRESAHNAFRQVLQYTNQTPRAFKAFAQGNNRLQGYLNKNFPKEKAV
jgi:CRISPR system Cascade subunit CasA